MREKTKKIVVTGDVTIDWLQWSVKAKDAGDKSNGELPQNWELYDGTRMAAKPGGAMLLARMLQNVTDTTVSSPKLDEKPANISPKDVLHSIVRLDKFPYSSDNKNEKHFVYRVKEYCGYAGPEDGSAKTLVIKDDTPDAEIVVIDDAGNGFRDDKSVWPRALLVAGKQPIVILKMCRPLMTGQLWKYVQKIHAERLVVVISADDLRSCGINISRRLSWERTARDFVCQMASNRDLIPLAKCHNLIVRFGLDGAIHHKNSGAIAETQLYYDPLHAEGDYSENYNGGMVGLASAFVAAITACILKHGLNGIGRGIRNGILSSRRLLKSGFVKKNNLPDYPYKDIFKFSKDDPRIADILIDSSGIENSADTEFWTILNNLAQKGLEEVAKNIVKKGYDPDMSRVPVGQFGEMKTFDRTEIESLRSIKNIIREYLAKGQQKRPLSIAVFGPPGSGKSFSVSQVAKSVGQESIKKLEFNLSQWDSHLTLVRALHQVRDIVLSGKVPLVFFDEFDSAFQGPLGWLKYFLNPMQDGEFKDGEITYHVGKAIFVFAGGTSSTFKQFSKEGTHQTNEEMVNFKDAKCPDFVSRLRGYVDILGVNQTNENDLFCMVRRAMILRFLLEKKAKHFFDSTGNLRIDDGVLRAFIKVPSYKHGVRSIEAVLDMSMTTGRHIFEKSCIPPAVQLCLHVDANMFYLLINRDTIFGAAREKLARAIHKKFCEEQKNTNRPANDAGIQSWENLREYLKESNRQQADQIPEKLKAIGYNFIPLEKEHPKKVAFSQNEIEILAKIEHERWVSEKLLNGWKYGKKRNDKRKIHPCIKKWNNLPENEKEKDRQTVRRIPEFLAEAGFEIYRLV